MIITQTGKTLGPQIVLNFPALWFIYILMHGRQEWVLLQLGYQHKCVERPVWPVFPDYLFVSCDYVILEHVTCNSSQSTFNNISAQPYQIENLSRNICQLVLIIYPALKTDYQGYQIGNLSCNIYQLTSIIYPDLKTDCHCRISEWKGYCRSDVKETMGKQFPLFITYTDTDTFIANQNLIIINAERFHVEYLH